MKNRTEALYKRGKRLIPGGVQLLSKRPEMFAPGVWPPYYDRAAGCEVWDLDSRHYYDMSINGVGACLLGFADPDVNRAVKESIDKGSMSTLNPPEEVELAERLCAIHPWADRVRFTRTGGEAAAVAIRIARATTGRSLIAVCGYHGWHDWYLAANLGDEDALDSHLLPGLEPAGVPRELHGTTLTFRQDDLSALQRLVSEHGRELAAVIMEPCRHRDPSPGWLEAVRSAVDECGAMLIFDEITIGWRRICGGSHLLLGVMPDMAIFGKALSNGFPMAAIIGTGSAMSGAESSFISSTYWTERIGPVSALATLDKMAAIQLPARLERIGSQVAEGWRLAAAKHALPVIVPDGYNCLASFRFEHQRANALRTIFTRLMLQRGFLAGAALYVTLAHTEEIADLYLNAVEHVFSEIAGILERGHIDTALDGPEAQTGFKRLLD